MHLHPRTTVFGHALDASLQQRISAAASDERVPAIVLLRERVDLNALSPQLLSLGRRARHERVVRALQETAARSQGPLLAYLEHEALRGRAGRIEPFWIANAIAVEATPAVLAELARRPDVLAVQENSIETIDTVAAGPAPAACPAGVEPGLIVVGAERMWARGWSGDGVLVATVDTGAHLPHVTLQPRWRGNEPGVQPSEAWFDYFGQSTVPSDTQACQSHGTHVMGTMLGDGGLGSRIGLAPGAHWIASRIFGPIGGSQCSSSDSSKLAGWQWLIDPDGDPGTVDDFPHVVNRSGGQRAGGGGGYCRPLPDAIWDAISAIVAAGATVFFGAGNEGPAPMSIISWASQVHSPILAFSVGNVDAATEMVRSSSSRGPSPCDGVSIKPEVVAPGVGICSAVIGGYGIKTGTSMATPHVSGAAALLWQAFPHAGAERIQYALLNGVEDLGDPGEDNDYGMGLIYLPAAYHWLFDLTPSTIEVVPNFAVPGERLTYTMSIRAQGQVTGTARLSDTLPAELSFVTGSLWASEGRYGFADGTITWTGVLSPGLPVTVSFAVIVSGAFSDGVQVENVALLDDGLEVLERSAVTPVDAAPPDSWVEGPAYARQPFSVTFVASDTVSGVAWTELWTRYEEGAWTGSGMTQTGASGVFVLSPSLGEGLYYLAGRALDQVGWLEDAPEGDGDGSTLWDTQAPTSTAQSPVSSSVPSFAVSWSGEDGPSGSGIADYQIDVRQGESTWTVWLSQTEALSGTFVGATGQRYCFRSSARDRAGNRQVPPGNPQGHTCTDVEQWGRIFLPMVVRGNG